MSLARIKGILLQNLFHFKHSLEDVIDAFFWPSMDVVIWGFMTSYFTNLNNPIGGIIAFLLGGLILWNIVWRAQQDITMAFLRNVWNKSLLNLFSSPLSPAEFIIATMLVGLIKIIFTLAFVSLIAFLFYSFNIFSLGFYLLPFFAILIAFAWAVGIFITGLIIRFGMRIQAFAWALIVLFHPVSAVFYPVAILPDFLQKIAWFLPTAHIFEGMRQVLSSHALSAEHLVWAAMLDGAYLILAALFFIFMFDKAKEKGKLAQVEV